MPLTVPAVQAPPPFVEYWQAFTAGVEVKFSVIVIGLSTKVPDCGVTAKVAATSDGGVEPAAGASDAVKKAYLTDVQVGSGFVVPAAVVVVVEPIVNVYNVPLAVSKRSVYPVGTVTFPAVVLFVFNA